MVGVNRTTVYEWPEYVEAAERLKRVYTLPRGSRDEDGNLEAW
jgi:predicted regulator of amino acid metabolism with ACT domain